MLQNFVEPQGPLKGKPVHLNVIPPEAVDVRQPRLEMDLPVCPCDEGQPFNHKVSRISLCIPSIDPQAC